jgi:hypothetical protein
MTDHDPIKAAFAHYNGHYDNEAYQAVRKAILLDLQPDLRWWEGLSADMPADQLDMIMRLSPTNAILNSVIDAALEASGHGDFANAHATLTDYLRRIPALRAHTVAHVNAYLARFNEAHPAHLTLTQLEKELRA